MFRIDHTSNANALPTPGTAGTAGYFTEGDAQTGVEATVVTADWLNQIQEELVYLLTQAAITPAKANYTQIYTALTTLFRLGGNARTVISEEPADPDDVTLSAAGQGHLVLGWAAGDDITITHISGGVGGQSLLLTQATDAARDVYISHREGNIWLSRDFDLTGGQWVTPLSPGHTLHLVYDAISEAWREPVPITQTQCATWQAFAPGTTCTTGDGKGFVVVPRSWDNMKIGGVLAGVATPGSTSGTMDIQIRRKREGASVDILSTKITLAVGEYYADDGVVNPDYRVVKKGDQLVLDVDSVHGTPAEGLTIALSLYP